MFFSVAGEFVRTNLLFDSLTFKNIWNKIKKDQKDWMNNLVLSI